MQQSSPSVPQGAQEPPTQTSPLRHSSSAQHASPARPQSPAGRVHCPVGEQIRSEQQSLGVRHELPSGEQQEPPTQSKSPQHSLGEEQLAPPGVAQHRRSEPQRVPGVQGVLPMQHICPRSPQSPPPPVSRVEVSRRTNVSLVLPSVGVPPPGSQARAVRVARAKKAKRDSPMA